MASLQPCVRVTQSFIYVTLGEVKFG